jgi:hypothetical protein
MVSCKQQQAGPVHLRLQTTLEHTQSAMYSMKVGWGKEGGSVLLEDRALQSSFTQVAQVLHAQAVLLSKHTSKGILD